ncbi:MAG: thioredoxin-disulfide reductase [Azospirillaceae bacterium]|nr:thioredoxin-disulfide reductase [Azospirillaceae bacterium]
MTTHRTKVLIIGGGPAGYTAGIYAARANLQPILVQGMQPGGQLMITTEVENYPGFAQAVQGPDLMEQMRQQAEHVGTTLVYDVITSVDFSQRPFVCKADSGDEFVADTVVIATGAQARWLGVPGEQEYQGAGVSACATCDGFFFRGKEVAVIGGGNTALEEALYLTHHASKVTLVHRRDSFRGEKILHDRVFANPKIEVLWNHKVDQVLGKGGAPDGGFDFNNPKQATGLALTHTGTGETRELPLDGVFVAIGHDPATALFKGHVDLDEEGYVITAPDSTRTSVPGVFAAGDVKDKVFRQAVTAAGMGCMAALEAERFLGGH